MRKCAGKRRTVQSAIGNDPRTYPRTPSVAEEEEDRIREGSPSGWVLRVDRRLRSPSQVWALLIPSGGGHMITATFGIEKESLADLLHEVEHGKVQLLRGQPMSVASQASD